MAESNGENFPLDIPFHSTDVVGVKEEVNSTQQELASTRSELQRVIGDLGVQSDLVAHNRRDQRRERWSFFNFPGFLQCWRSMRVLFPPWVFLFLARQESPASQAAGRRNL